MDAGLGAMLFMAVVLKIPVAAACWLLYTAIRAEPDPIEGGPDDGGSEDHGRRRFRREPLGPKGPRGPRRGPHAPDTLPLPCPADDGALRVARPTGAPARERVRQHRSS